VVFISFFYLVMEFWDFIYFLFIMVWGCWIMDFELELEMKMKIKIINQFLFWFFGDLEFRVLIFCWFYDFELFVWIWIFLSRDVGEYEFMSWVGEEVFRGFGEDEGSNMIMVILVPLAYMDIHQFSPSLAWKTNTTVEVASLAARSAQLTVS